MSAKPRTKATPRSPKPRAPRASNPPGAPRKARAPAPEGRGRWGLWVGLAVLAVALSFGAWVGVWLLRPHAGRGVVRRVPIPEGVDADSLALALYRAEVIDRPWLFALFAGLTDAAGSAPQGEVLLRDDLSPRAVLRALASGTGLVRVTLPEGLTRFELAARLTEARVLSSPEEFLRRAGDPATVRALGLRGETLEGYLFPDTYDLPPNATTQEVLERLVRNWRRRFEELRRRNPEGFARAQRAGVDDYGLLILASLVEKETGNAEDRTHVASVFWNRLQLPEFTPRLLQTDPTIVYGCRVAHPPSCADAPTTGRIPITRAMLEDASNPYNTYRHERLPPGPIANPGLRSLEAVLSPAETRDLYFVAMGNGRSAFARTRAEHEANVQRYLRAPRDAGATSP